MKRVLRLSVGWVWGSVLLLFGVWLWRERVGFVSACQGLLGGADGGAIDRAARSLSVFAVAWGYFVFLLFVAEVVCSRAPLGMRRFMQAFAGATAVGGLFSMVWHIATVIG